MKSNVKIDEVNNVEAIDKKITVVKMFWIFFIACFLGTVIEMIFCFIIENRIMTRAGVIYGPFNPVYGFGALLITILLHNFRDKKKLYIFLITMVVGAGFEYICSLFQELAFGTITWEYSNTFLNLQGRTNFAYSVFWGTLGVFWIKTAYPILDKFIENIMNLPKKIGVILTVMLFIFMSYNCFISIAASRRQYERRQGIGPSNSFEIYLDNKYTDEYLKKVFPMSRLVE
ncbi:MAG: hypothetical protein E7311_05065 [Clostridiales bacterium]|nr:hypothetical protein [Clostridiales bacterium]